MKFLENNEEAKTELCGTSAVNDCKPNVVYVEFGGAS